MPEKTEVKETKEPLTLEETFTLTPGQRLVLVGILPDKAPKIERKTIRHIEDVVSFTPEEMGSFPWVELPNGRTLKRDFLDDDENAIDITLKVSQISYLANIMKEMDEKGQWAVIDDDLYDLFVEDKEDS